MITLSPCKSPTKNGRPFWGITCSNWEGDPSGFNADLPNQILTCITWVSPQQKTAAHGQLRNCPFLWDAAAKSCIIRVWNSQTNSRSLSPHVSTLCWLTFSVHSLIWICHPLRILNLTHSGIKSWMLTLKLLPNPTKQIYEHNLRILRRSLG